MKILNILEKLRKNHRAILEADMHYRYEVGTKANEYEEWLLKKGFGRQNPYKTKKQIITGTGTLFATECGLSCADVSRFRAMARLFTWGQIIERLDHGWSWSFFKILIDKKDQLGQRFYKIPLNIEGYLAFKIWVNLPSWQRKGKYNYA